MTSDSLAHMSDRDLLTEVKGLAQNERRATADLIAALAELDARRLYLAEGCSSLFTYCTQVLHLSEHAAYGRIEAARAARRFPVILDLLADGSVTLTTVCLLASHMTPENHREVLAAARRKTKREVELLVAMLAPRPAVPASVRKLPGPKPTDALCAHEEDGCEDRAPLTSLSVPALPKRQAIVAPLAPDRYRVQFTASRETHDKLRRAQDLLRHTIPDGDPAIIFDRALTLLLTHLEKTKHAAAERPRAPRSAAAGSRHIPAAVRREVWTRDGGQCAFGGAGGRCTERGFLELHHVVPFAVGGQAHVENIQLRCRAHNAYEADRYFGPSVVRERGGMYDHSVRLGPDRVGARTNRHNTPLHFCRGVDVAPASGRRCWHGLTSPPA